MLAHFGISVLPVLLFLVALVALDSFKLISVRSILVAIACGMVTAVAAYFTNTLLREIGVDTLTLYRYAAPVVEEVVKALVIWILLLRNRIGFLVDAAIFGFAVGTGFAVLENVYYLGAVTDATVFTWIIRGFGTAVMHGSVTAIYAIVSKSVEDRGWSKAAWPLPGLVVAVALHSIYNHFLLPPVVSTLVLIVVMPVLTVLIFQQSEAATRDWLGVGFDSDQELLELIKSGNISQTRVGQYLQSLRDRFGGEVIADMLCWLRIQVELSIKAKGVMLMREAGFKPPQDPATRAKLEELDYLESSIGKTGILAIAPVVHASRRDVWQMRLLGSN